MRITISFLNKFGSALTDNTSPQTMVSDLDNAGSGPDPANSEHQPCRQLKLMDLPTDVIEEIARKTGESLCYFALAHPRLATIISRLKQRRIEIKHTCENLLRSVAVSTTNVHALILVNCHSESSLLLSLIMKCPNLTELNTVNSGLTDPDLVQSINFLSRLETLKCTCFEGPADAEEATLIDNHSIKSLYVEHGPKAFVYLLKLVNSCLRIERLHLVEPPLPCMEDERWQFDVVYRDGALPVDPPISRERWQTLQTLIIFMLGIPYSSSRILSLFQNCTNLDFDIREFSRKKAIVYDRGNFNVRAPRTVIVDDESPLLNGMYSVGLEHPVWHYGQPRHLEIEDSRARSLSGSLPQSIASLTTLVELDLSTCHTKNQPHIWDPLLQSSAGLGSLTVPLCLLTVGSCDKHENEVFPFVEALEKLKLKKLRCSSRNCKPPSSYENRQNTRCHYSRLLPCLTGLRHLEELTLINPQVGRDFVSRIAIRSMSYLKIIKEDVGYLNFPKLKSFFKTCRKLRYLKLDWRYLPLQERLLWWRLIQANLKQLCIKSYNSKQAVDLRVVRRFLPKLCENLDILHVHAHCLPNAEQFSSFLEAEIAKINLTKEHNPVVSVPANSESFDTRASYEIVPNYPGRALCYPGINSRYELIGWDLH